MFGVVSATGADTQRSPVVDTRVVATPCTAGRWAQTPANVTSAMANGTLLADTIVSSTDAWAVGVYDTPTETGSLWEQWTGGSSWHVISDDEDGVQLDAVTSFGADNVWAAGSVNDAGIDTAAITEWNGVKIVRVNLPLMGPYSELASISGSSESDIWAVGNWIQDHHQHVLLYHYNGTTWSLAPAPNADPYSEVILDLSPTNVYMVVPFLHNTTKVRLYHYNGVAWSVDLREIPINYAYTAFAGSSGSDLYGNDASDEGVDHWNGTTWSHVGTFNTEVTVNGVAEGPVGTVWSDGLLNASSREVYVAENGVRQTNPSAVMTQTGVMNGVTSGAGLVIAVGGQEEDGTIPHSEPIVVMSCS